MTAAVEIGEGAPIVYHDLTVAFPVVRRIYKGKEGDTVIEDVPSRRSPAGVTGTLPPFTPEELANTRNGGQH